MSNLPVGVFDSGVGGLTVLRALMAQMPHESFIYLGDTARLPYGTKSAETVERYAVQAAGKLAECGVKCIVVACNTASAVGLDAIRKHMEGTPLIGVVEPGAEAACRASQSAHIAVIATEGTIRGGAYQEAILRRRSNAKISARPAPLFVALAEEGLHEGAIAQSVAHHYLQPLFDTPDFQGSRPDTLVLGCTHFPMLIGAIRSVIGPQVCIVDSAATTAKTVHAELGATGLARETGATSVRFIATDSPERFARVGSRFLGRNISPQEVELVDL